MVLHNPNRIGVRNLFQYNMPRHSLACLGHATEVLDQDLSSVLLHRGGCQDEWNFACQVPLQNHLLYYSTSIDILRRICFENQEFHLTLGCIHELMFIRLGIYVNDVYMT